jgi:hypothetical protein
MARNQLIQSQRTKNDPLLLGNFDQTTIRYLTGKLGPVNRVIGRADTNQTSNGGFGGGTYNHWFQVNLELPAWIILAKGEPRPKYIQISVYDLNNIPITGRAIFDTDSIEVRNSTVYHPYVGHAMGNQSDLYNYFNQYRLDRGDDRYYALPEGSYLICISSTRNEPLDYSLGLIIETADPTPFLLLEDYSRMLYEDTDEILCDVTIGFDGEDIHEHSLTEWKTAWERDHQSDKPFPPLLVPLATVP